MELKEIQRLNEEVLFEDYLTIPTLDNYHDRNRFVLWALCSRLNASGFTSEKDYKLRKAGLSDQEIKDLHEAYEWFANILDVIR